MGGGEEVCVCEVRLNSAYLGSIAIFDSDRPKIILTLELGTNASQRCPC